MNIRLFENLIIRNVKWVAVEPMKWGRMKVIIHYLDETECVTITQSITVLDET